VCAVVLTDNYFELFGLPAEFDVDENRLATLFRALQSAAHPDKFAGVGDAERRLAVQRSSHINEAFQTLKDPLRRARYLLAVRGVPVDDMQTVVDTEFLFEQMELREALADIRNHADPASMVAELISRIDTGRMGLQDELQGLFSAGDAVSLARARECVQRLQFMVKLREEALNTEEELL
jgi:molecular chaperone HscB